MAKNQQTLCWECDHHCKCSWMREGQPVEKWNAAPSKIFQKARIDRNGKGHTAKTINSFLIINCPEFKPYEATIYSVNAADYAKQMNVSMRTFYRRRQKQQKVNLIKINDDLFATLRQLTVVNK